jgi:ankyrin repeat protein
MDLEDVNDTDRYGRTQLHIQAEKGSKAKVLSLIEEGAEIDLGDDTEKTALHYAVLNGHVAIVKILLDQGADSNAKDENGYSPLLLVRKNEQKIIPLLIEFGANLESQNMHGQTLLNIAAEKRDINFVKYLISLGADVNTKDSRGMTPLLSSAKAKNIAVIEFLLEHKTQEGTAIVDLACQTDDGKSFADFYEHAMLNKQLSLE